MVLVYRRAGPQNKESILAVGVFDLLKTGIGPSSSHTVGPMRAARMFTPRLVSEGALSATDRIKCELYGSLGGYG
jgi:L-serine dehydratase